MSLVIYLGLHAFVREPDQLMPKGQLTMSLEALQKDVPEVLSQQHTMLLEQLGEPEGQMLSQWLKQNSEHSAILLWPQPALYVAAALAAAQAPEQALQTWAQQVQHLLTLFRKHRRQVQLAGYTPGEAPALESATLPVPKYVVSPLYRVAAAQLTLQDSTLQKAYSYLQASSVAGGQASIATLNDIDALLQQKCEDENEYADLLSQLDQAQQTLEEQHHQLKQAEKEQQALAKQLAEQQSAAEKASELEKHLAESTAKLSNTQSALKKEQTARSAEQREHKQQLAKAQEQHQRVKAELASTHEENTLVIAELHRVQEVLETTLETAQKHQQQIKELETERSELNQQQSVLVQQHEAQEKALADSKTAWQNATNKAEQRLTQLHKAQEELEQQQQVLSSLTQKLENRQKNLNVLRAERQQKEHELQSLVQWLRAHAYRHAAAAYRYSRAYRKALPEQVKLVQNSDYFDAAWYREQYPDVSQGKINPAEHFVKFGALEGRNPSARFNTEFYLAAHNDVAISGQHPLLHFLRHGMAEQRATTFQQLQLPSPESTNATHQAFDQEAQA